MRNGFTIAGKPSFTIFGDSLSTYDKISIPPEAVYYDFYNCAKYGLKSVADTWWQKVIDHYGGSLCINNSYSGSKVSGTEYPAACSSERLQTLRNWDSRPDIILVYLGMNDFGFGAPVYRPAEQADTDTRYFADAYPEMLKEIKKREPQAKVFCATLMRTYLKGRPYMRVPEQVIPDYSLADYDEAIRKAVREQGCFLVDLAASGVTYETLDGTHPTAVGHATIAKAWIGMMGEEKAIS